MKEPVNILVVDDDEDVLITAEVVLKQKFKVVNTLSNPAEIPMALKAMEYQIALLDMNYATGGSSGKEGLKWLSWIYNHYPEIQVIMITAYGEVNLAVEAMKLGAVDFVMKPWEYAKIQETVAAAWRLSKNRQQADHKRFTLPSQESSKTEIIGESEKMKRVFEMIRKVAATDANVLILGENGTGKELVAQALHEQSNRSTNAFVNVDMGSLSENLFESELFGHKKGAFTDAKEDRIGRFESAHHGTIFLDEIGNLSMAMQSKLLSVLQKKNVIRLGENKERAVDVRVLSATNMPLENMIAEGQFREDLLYRLNTIEITLPPLRDRGNDLMLLAQHFLKINAQKYGKERLSFSPEAIKKLKEYRWPGNVRELEHTIERAVIMASNAQISGDDLLLKTSGRLVPKEETTNLEAIEKRTIKEVIERCHGNMSHVAKELGIGRTTLYRKLEKYGL